MYRSLLVHLDDQDACVARVDFAIRLARRLECHLVGLAPAGRAPVSLGLEGSVALEQAMEYLHRIARQSARYFDESCQAAGLVSVESVVSDDDTARSVVTHAHCSDLVIMGQGARASDREAVEQVVLQSARPTLVVPCAGRLDTLGDNVLVAWNDSPEAARAVADAMPLLCRAGKVTVMQCDTPADEARADGARRKLEALRRWLMWHGVDAQVQLETTEIDVGNALLSRAADLGADLLVMGAYGRPRWTERVLGGATRTLLASMTLPVLMSH